MRKTENTRKTAGHSRIRASLEGTVVIIIMSLISSASSFSCSGKTHYFLDIDVLSYLPREILRGEQTLETDIDEYLYLLPYGGFYDENVSIDEELTEGMEIEFPVPDNPVGEDLVLTFRTNAAITNLSASSALATVRIALFIAPLETENVFEDGTRALNFEVPTLDPGETAYLEGMKRLRQGDSGFDILSSGAARLGVRAYFEANLSNAVTFSYSLNDLGITISTRPFAMIP